MLWYHGVAQAKTNTSEQKLIGIPVYIQISSSNLSTIMKLYLLFNYCTIPFVISLARGVHILRLNYRPVLSCYTYWLFPISSVLMFCISLSEKHMDKYAHFGRKKKKKKRHSESNRLRSEVKTATGWVRKSIFPPNFYMICHQSTNVL